MRTELNQVYAEPGGAPLHLDFFRPEGEGLLPLVLCIHGGGWISGGKDDMREIAYLLAQNGFAAACVQYRLAPLHPYPAAVRDVQAAVRYVRKRAVDWMIDPQKIAALGNSAGGHLATMLGVTNPPAPDGEERGARSQVNAVVAICPITDLAHPRSSHFEISFSFLEQFMGGPFEGHEERYREASPMEHVTPDDPPFLIIHGEADEIVPVQQSDAFVEKLTHNGVDVLYHRMPGEGHGFSPRAFGLIMSESLNFLRTKLS